MKFKNYIETESGIKDTGGLPGTAGQVLSSTVTGTDWIDQKEITAGSATVVTIECKNTHTTPLTKGTPVYQTGTVGATDVIEIAPGNALVSTGAQPSIGLLQQDLAINEFGYVIITGELLNITTDPIDGLTPVTGQKVFVKSGGGLTLTKPTTELNSIQNMGLVGKVSGGNAGSITVSSIMRTNDVPNLPTGRIWIGDGNTIVSDTVYVDELNGRVGIGTTSPGFELSIGDGLTSLDQSIYVSSGIFPGGGSSNLYLSTGTSGTSTIGMGSAQFAAQNTAGKIIYSDIVDTFSFNTNFSTKMVINGTGNVGIGTTSPQAKLHVANGTLRTWTPTAGTSAIFESTASNRNFVTITGANESELWFGDAATQAKGRVRYEMANNNMEFWTNATQKMAINNVGNVGIGTTTFTSISSSSSTLSLGSTSATTSGGIAFQVSGGIVKAYNYVASNYLINQTVSGIGQIFYGAGSERMRIHNTTGNVGIGITNPQTILHIGTDSTSGSTTEELKIQTGTGGGYGGTAKLWLKTGQYGASTINVGREGPFGTSSGFINYDDGLSKLSIGTNFSTKMVIDGIGNVGIGTTVANVRLEIGGGPTLARVIPSVDNQGYIGDSQHRWQAIYATNGTIQTSDIREKTEIKPTKLGLDFINDLTPVSYKWIEGERLDASKDERNHQGLIAQEVAKTLEKHGVDKNKFGGLDIQKTDEYNDFHAMSYEQLIAPMIKAIQELKAEIEELKKQINK